MRYVVDAGALLRIVADDLTISSNDELLAPTLIRSQVLSALHEQVSRRELEASVAEERLAKVGRMSIRLLGDAVLRRNAWRIADQLGWASTYDAEYIALTVLQADALVTADPEFARQAATIVKVADIAELGRG